MLFLLGLKDDYQHDGRVLVEDLNQNTLPRSLRGDVNFRILAQLYKLINAPVNKLGLDSLKASTRALGGDDVTYAKVESELNSFTSQRNALAGKMIQQLEDAEFNGKSLDRWSTWSESIQALRLLDKAEDLNDSER